MFRTVIPILFILLATPSQESSATTAETIQSQVTRAVAQEADSQRQYRNWTDRRDEASSEIRDMKLMDSWLEYQIMKYGRYIAKQEEVIAELERRKEEAARIEMELEPFLETVVDSLEAFVATDLPFLPDERSRRIQFLRESLDDYRLELSEKLRRVFEALLVETEYGRNVSATQVELTIRGLPTQVSIFRLGRTALYYQTADGASAGVWNPSVGQWRPLDESSIRTLKTARDMADRKRAVELLNLPLGAVR